MKDLRQKRKGMVLAMVVILMVVISVFFLVALSMLYTNASVSRVQYEISKVYYLARAGAEVAYGALQAENEALFKEKKLLAEDCVRRGRNPSANYDVDSLEVDGHPVEVKMRLIRQGDKQILENYFIEIVSSAQLADASKSLTLLVSITDINLKWLGG